MSARQFLNISSYKTASRCWIPIKQISSGSSNNLRFFSSKQRCINFNNLHESNLIANDGVFTSAIHEELESTPDFESFEPTVFSSEEIHTAGPVNKA